MKAICPICDRELRVGGSKGGIISKTCNLCQERINIIVAKQSNLIKAKGGNFRQTSLLRKVG